MTHRTFEFLLAVILACGTPACEKRSAPKSAPPEAASQMPEPIPPRKVAATTVAISDDQIGAKVIELVSEQSGKSVRSISSTTNLKQDLKMDDLDNVGLVMQLEDTFGFAIPDEDAKRLSTVAAITDYIRFRRSAK